MHLAGMVNDVVLPTPAQENGQESAVGGSPDVFSIPHLISENMWVGEGCHSPAALRGGVGYKTLQKKCLLFLLVSVHLWALGPNERKGLTSSPSSVVPIQVRVPITAVFKTIRANDQINVVSTLSQAAQS